MSSLNVCSLCVLCAYGNTVMLASLGRGLSCTPEHPQPEGDRVDVVLKGARERATANTIYCRSFTYLNDVT